MRHSDTVLLRLQSFGALLTVFGPLSRFANNFRNWAHTAMRPPRLLSGSTPIACV